MNRTATRHVLAAGVLTQHSEIAARNARCTQDPAERKAYKLIAKRYRDGIAAMLRDERRERRAARAKLGGRK